MSEWWMVPEKLPMRSPSQEWQKYTADYDPDSYSAEAVKTRSLLPHQKNLIRWVSFMCATWRPGAPPQRRGVLAFHNTGAGKTAEMVGAALGCRVYNPEVMVVFVASSVQINNLFSGEIVDEYNNFFPVSMKKAAGLPETLDSKRVMWDRLPGVPKYDYRTQQATTKGVNSHSGCAVLPDFGKTASGAPAVIGITISRLGAELTKLREAKLGKQPWDNDNRFPLFLESVPVLYIFDEAHNLQKPPAKAGSADYEDRYDVLRQHFLTPESQSNSFLTLMSATPATTVGDMMRLSQLLVAGDNVEKIEQLILTYLTDGVLTDTVLDEWASLLHGVVDAWQGLRCFALYPKLRFVNTNKGSSPLSTMQSAAALLDKSEQQQYTTVIERLLLQYRQGKLKLSPGELRYLSTFNPEFDKDFRTLRSAPRLLRRSAAKFRREMPDYCETGQLKLYSPKIFKLSSFLRTGSSGKQWIACLDTTHYNCSAAIEAVLEGCLGFEKLSLEPLTKLRGSTPAKMSTALLKSLKGRRRRFFSTRQLMRSDIPLETQKLLWDAIKNKTTGLYNLVKNDQGKLLEVVLTHSPVFNEGVSVPMLRHVHLVDVMPMDSVGQIIGRGQRPGSFGREKDPERRVINVHLYPVRWKEAEQIVLYKFFSQKVGLYVHELSSKKKWVEQLKKKLNFLSNAADVHPFVQTQARLATEALSDFLAPALDAEIPVMPLTGELLLSSVSEFAEVLRMYMKLMSVSTNCLVAAQSMKRYGQLSGGVDLDYTCETLNSPKDSKTKLQIDEPTVTLWDRFMGKTFFKSSMKASDLVEEKEIIQGLRAEFGEHSASAAYETFANMIEDILMTDPYSNKRRQ